MSTMNSCSVAGSAQHVRAARGGLPRPRRTSSSRPPAPVSPRQRPAGSRAGAGGSEVMWGRAGCSWWGSGAQATTAPRRQACRASTAARVPTGNRELVRRALSPPPTGGRGAALRRWSFRPTPSRLRNASSFSSIGSPASPRPS